jgi:hypothetical protein
VKILVKSPFLPNLLLSVGGYSFAIWNEGIMVTTNQGILSVTGISGCVDDTPMDNFSEPGGNT